MEDEEEEEDKTEFEAGGTEMRSSATKLALDDLFGQLQGQSHFGGMGQPMMPRRRIIPAMGQPLRVNQPHPMVRPPHMMNSAPHFMLQPGMGMFRPPDRPMNPSAGLFPPHHPSGAFLRHPGAGPLPFPAPTMPPPGAMKMQPPYSQG